MRIKIPINPINSHEIIIPKICAICESPFFDVDFDIDSDLDLMVRVAYLRHAIAGGISIPAPAGCRFAPQPAETGLLTSAASGSPLSGSNSI